MSKISSRILFKARKVIGPSYRPSEFCDHQSKLHFNPKRVLFHHTRVRVLLFHGSSILYSHLFHYFTPLSNQLNSIDTPGSKSIVFHNFTEFIAAIDYGINSYFLFSISSGVEPTTLLE